MKRKTEKRKHPRKSVQAGGSLVETGRIEVISHKRQKEVLITGVKQILVYGTARMIFSIKDGRLAVEGSGLDCRTYQSGALGIVGIVSSLSFLEDEG